MADIHVNLVRDSYGAFSLHVDEIPADKVKEIHQFVTDKVMNFPAEPKFERPPAISMSFPVRVEEGHLADAVEMVSTKFDKISTIKLLRMLTMYGLKETKMFVDEVHYKRNLWPGAHSGFREMYMRDNHIHSSS